MRYRRKHDRHRPRGWFSLFLRLGGWISLIFGVVLVVLTLISATNLYLADRMDRDGAFAQAAVTGKRVEIGTDSDGDETRTYYVTFAYKTSAGGRTAEAIVDRAFYTAAAVDDEHLIRYLRDDPGRIEHEIGQYRRGGTVLRYIGLVTGLIGLAALWFYGQRANRAVKARRDGEKRYAVIQRIAETGVTVNDRPQGRLEWREEDGQLGKSLMRSMAELRKLYEAGDRIVVFRLGRDAYWEGDVGPPRREARVE
ncbi:MAG: hypothetical protein LJE68_11965 [Rhodobacter sp.]|nr:hypothetical protein [Rhodobacter sp.]